MKLRIPTIMLLFAIVASAASCGEQADVTVTETTAVPQETEAVRTPYIEKNDYEDANFTVFAPVWGIYENFMFADEQTGR